MTRHLLAVMFVCTFFVLTLSSCASPCDQYCTLLANCIADEWDGDYAYWGYDDWDDAYDECIDRHEIPGGPAIQNANQNSCKIMADVFDVEDCM